MKKLYGNLVKQLHCEHDMASGDEPPGEIDMLKSPSLLLCTLALCLLCSPGRSLAMEAKTVRTISEVNLSPDSKRVSLRFTGRPAGHVAFVMEQPYRLVVDFRETSLGRVARKIPAPLPPLTEIRIGQHDTRARLVADFGSNPVPPFKINRVGDRVFVVFQPGVVRPGDRTESSDDSVKSLRTRSRSSTQARRTKRGERPSEMVVKKATMEGNLIVLELATPRGGGRRYHLVLDCDLQDLSVHNATVSDRSGAVKRFDFVRTGLSGPTSTVEADSAKGPTKGDERTGGRRPTVRKFKWGLPAASRSDRSPTREKGGPLRVERFKLQPRQVADQR